MLPPLLGTSPLNLVNETGVTRVFRSASKWVATCPTEQQQAALPWRRCADEFGEGGEGGAVDQEGEEQRGLAVLMQIAHQ